MEDEDFRKLLIAAAIASCMPPKAAISIADVTIAILQDEARKASNDED